ncbi:MAG: KH domain-containing protein [bacterium]|nr:KH domain-containing protein [bacterium]
MAVSIDQQFIEYIVKSVVGHPDDVKIERRIDEKGVLLELLVNPEDLGRVIGKRGATAQSLRTLLRALGTKNDARYNLKIIDTGYPEGKGPKTPVESDDNSTGQADDRTLVADEPAVADDSASADEPADKPVDEPAATSVADEPATTAPVDDLDMGDDEELPETPSESHSDVVSRTRKELADLDDLDV